MIRTRGRKIIRDIWARKGRTILVSTAIFIGVMGTIALFTLNFVITGQLREDLKEDELAMLDLFIQQNEGKQPNDALYFEELGQLDGVTDVVALSSQFTEFKLEEDADDFEDAFVTGLSVPFEELKIEPMSLIDGAYPAENAQELMIERRMADKFELEVGDTIYLRVLGREADATDETANGIGTTEAWTISGIVFHPYIGGGGGFSGDPEVSIYANFNDIELISGVPGYNNYRARFIDFETAEERKNNFSSYLARGALNYQLETGISAEEFANHFDENGEPLDDHSDDFVISGPGITESRYEVADCKNALDVSPVEEINLDSETYTICHVELPPSNEIDPYAVGFVQASDPDQNQLIQGATTLASTLSTLALISLVVSGFLVFNVINSLIAEQKRQIGIMKTIGATTTDNFTIYTGIAFGYGLIGVIPGLILGIIGGNAVSHALAPELNTYLDGFKYSLPAIIIGVLVGILIPVSASLLPVFFGARVKVLDAITDLGISNSYGQGIVAKFIERLPVPITVRQGISNVSLKPVRQALTVVTLSLAVGVFMGIFALFTSLTSGINSYIDTFNVEIGVFPQDTRSTNELVGVINEEFVNVDDPKIDNIGLGFQLQVEFEDYEQTVQSGGPPGVFAYGYEYDSDDPAFLFEVDEGSEITTETAENGIIFSSALANNMGVDVGDTAMMIVPAGEAEVLIVGIADFPVDQVWMDWRALARIARFTTDVAPPNQYFSAVNLGDAGEIGVLGADEQLGTFLTFNAGNGEYLTDAASEIVISASLAEQGGYSIGDSVSLTSQKGDTKDYTVVGIAELPPQLPAGTPTEFIIMDYDELIDFEDVDLTAGEPRPQGYFLTTTIDDPSQQEVAAIMEDIDESFNERGWNVITFNFIELKNQISTGFITIQIILQSVAFLIAMVGALGLLTTLSMSVFERQKEIGVMRSIGASSSTVAVQFLTEGVIVGFISWVIGLPLGYAIQVLLLEVTGFGGLFLPVLDPIAAIIGFVGMMAITVVASLWPSFSAARKTVSDILRYQ